MTDGGYDWDYTMEPKVSVLVHGAAGKFDTIIEAQSDCSSCIM
jgi:hypothetical protein